MKKMFQNRKLIISAFREYVRGQAYLTYNAKEAY